MRKVIGVVTHKWHKPSRPLPDGAIDITEADAIYAGTLVVCDDGTAFMLDNSYDAIVNQNNNPDGFVWRQLDIRVPGT